MIKVHYFSFGPFSENTYVVSDSSNECIIVDAGCFDANEEKQLSDYIALHNLKPVQHILTHAHIDHVWGADFVFNTYGLLPCMHSADQPTYDRLPMSCMMFGLPSKQPLKIATYLDATMEIKFGSSTFSIIHVPGHAPGHIAFYNKAENILIQGDCIIQGSIGRTDLPGGNLETLMQSILTKILVLPDETTLYSGHGMPTTVAFEKENNQVIKQFTAHVK